MKKHLLAYFLLLSILALPGLAFSQIVGRAIRIVSPAEENRNNLIKGLSNIQVKAYGISKTGKLEIIAQTQTDTQGNYFLNVREGESVKLVFEEGSNKFQSNRFTPQIRFVKSPATDINWEVYQPAYYVSGNPYLVAPV